MTMHTSPDAGWYAEPNGGPGLRYWDGATWTGATQPAPATTGYPAANASPAALGYPATGYPSTGSPSTGYPVAPHPGSGPTPVARPTKFLARNRFFVITLAICGIYALVAAFSHFAFFGIVPVLYTFRSFQAKEPLAIAALVVTAATIYFSLTHIYG